VDADTDNLDHGCLEDTEEHQMLDSEVAGEALPHNLEDISEEHLTQLSAAFTVAPPCPSRPCEEQCEEAFLCGEYRQFEVWQCQ